MPRENGVAAGVAAGDSEVDYPPLYQSADRTSAAKQRAYFASVKIELMLLVAVALASAVPWNELFGDTGRRVGAAGALALLLGAVACRVVRGAYRFEEHWFEARALAESVKVEAWRYMMKAEPYDLRNADGPYAQRIRQLIQRNEAVFGALAEKPAAGMSQITKYMREMRAGSLGTRRQVYMAKRLGHQQRWYQERAEVHGKADNRWTGAGYVFEGLALAFAILAIVLSLDLGLLGMFTTVAAAFTAWFQSKDFRRLAATYGVVAQDLSVIATQEGTARSEEPFRRLVDEVERTLSREHTFWLDRRLTH